MSGSLYIVGAVLVLIALAFIVIPLLRYRGESGVGITLPILVLIFPLAVFGIYSEVTTNLSPEEQIAAEEAIAQASPEVMVQQLAERMAEEPSLEGLQMLGQSYMVMERYPEAIDAWQQAWEMSGNSDPSVAIGYAEALIMSDQTTLRTDAAELLDFALKELPNNAKALWYGGLSAAARNMNDLAIERWTHLLNTEKLPEQLRMVIQQQLANLGAEVPEFGSCCEQPTRHNDQYRHSARTERAGWPDAVCDRSRCGTAASSYCGKTTAGWRLSVDRAA